MPNPAIEFIDVAKTYVSPFRRKATVEALRGVTFAVERGEVFAVVGPNRSGKTTLLKILMGLCRPTAGRVYRLGRPLSDRGTLAKVGYVHESQAFPRYLTATGLLEYYGRLGGMSRDRLRARVPAVLELTDLADRAGEPIARYSKGMVQRLALAQSALGEPELLVLDEPTEGLDLTARRVLRGLVSAQREGGKSVVLVSHALDEVGRLCDRLAVLVDGRVAFRGAVSELVRAPGPPLVSSVELAVEPLYRRVGAHS